MKRDHLKPYVFKVEGAANLSLYNMINGEFYRFSQEGNVEELRKELFKEGLIFESEGVVPAKIIKFDLMESKTRLLLRELQIRINGRGEDNCWSREKKKCESQIMSYTNLNRLQDMCQYIPIEKIRIEAEFYDKDKIDMVLNEFNFESVELYVESGKYTESFENIKKIYPDVNIRFIHDGKKRIKNQKIELFNFLYSEFFNPCLGHKVAVDANGDIKSCLWFDHILGNVENDDIKEMIIRGDFDVYWEADKMKIESCKDCELRRVCDDCRADLVNKKKDFYGKPSFCDYDPYKGS